MLRSYRGVSWPVDPTPPKRSTQKAVSNDTRFDVDPTCASCGSNEWIRHERRFGYVPFCGDCIEDAASIPAYSELGVGD